MSIKAMKQAIEAWDACGRYPDSTSDIERLDVAINALRTAIQQAEAKTDEPVAWLYIEDGEVMFGHPNGYRPPDARPLVFGDTHPAPGVPDDVVRDAERGRFLIEWLKRYGLLQAEFGQMGVGEKPENWWLLHAPWGIDKTRPFFGHGKTADAAIDAAMLAASPAQKGGE